MAITYVLRSLASDLAGGADFSNQLTEATAAGAEITIAVANTATETSFAWTNAGEPGADGATGNYTVEVRVVTENTEINISVQLDRVNSAGTVQASSSASAEQQASAGVKTFTFTALDLGTWSAGDRLRVRYISRDTSVHGNESYGIGANTTDEQVVAPFSAAGVSGDLAATEATDALASSGAVAIAGDLAATEATDTLVVAGAVAVTGALTATEPSDTIAASGTVADAAITGDFAVTETTDTIAATGGIAVSGNVAATEASDTLAATGGVAVAGGLAATEATDTLAASGGIGDSVHGDIAATEAADTMAASGNVPLTGSLAATEAADSLAATGTYEGGEAEPPAASGPAKPRVTTTTDLSGLGRQVQSGVRYRGSRQQFIDGKWVTDDSGLEDVGAPPRREDPPFEPPTPWTPDADVEEPEPSAAPTGRKGLGVRASKPPQRKPTPEPKTPRNARKRSIDQENEEAMAVLLRAVQEVWG